MEDRRCRQGKSVCSHGKVDIRYASGFTARWGWEDFLIWSFSFIIFTYFPFYLHFKAGFGTLLASGLRRNGSEELSLLYIFASSYNIRCIPNLGYHQTTQSTHALCTVSLWRCFTKLQLFKTGGSCTSFHAKAGILQHSEHFFDTCIG